MKRKTLTTVFFCLGANGALASSDLDLQNLQLLQEDKVSYEEFQQMVSGDQNAYISNGNYANYISNANYANYISDANYANYISAGNYADYISDANYTLGNSPASAEMAPPSPKAFDDEYSI